jgi:multiple sugar transport system permease protein
MSRKSAGTGQALLGKESRARKDRLVSRLFVLAILFFGGMIFAMPFLDMMFTSCKTDDEVALEHYRFLPKVPKAQHVSPYVVADPDNIIEKPADMSEETWSQLREPYTQAIRAAVEKWWDGSGFIRTYYAGVDRERAVAVMTETVGHAVLKRLSDKSRKAGVPEMVKEAGDLATDPAIFPEFKVGVPRFVLGDVRVRVADFSRRTAGRAEQWRLGSGPATLTLSERPLDAGMQASYDFQSSEDKAAVLRVSMLESPPSAAMAAMPNLASDEAAGVNRVHVSYLPDRSWAKIDLYVIREGQRFRMREPLYADNIRWTEVELRWPDPDKDGLSGHSYRLLDPVQAEPRDAETRFAVEMKLSPVSAPESWYAKATRNYVTAFIQAPLWRYIATSLALTILNIVLVVFASSLAAYAFARVDFPGRGVLFAVMLGTMMIPSQVTLIPTFLIYRHLGWYNTLLPLWVPSLFGTAFFIFMARQFLKTIPRELEEAARIDGCGFFRVYWHVMLPLIRPTLAAIAMFSFQGAWNNFMGPLIYLNDERLFNIAFGLWKFNLQAGAQAGGASSSLMMAGSFVMTVPLIVTFFLFQRYFIQGVTLSGLGGK